MITVRSFQCRFTSTLFILFATLQITACGTEELATAISPDIGSNSTTEILNTSNRASIIYGVDTGSVIEDVDPDNNGLLEVAGKLDIIDNDNGEAAFIAKKITGNYGELEIDTSGNWNYTADNSQSIIQDLTGNETLTDNLTVSSIDGTIHTIKITIIGVIDTNNNSGNTQNNPAIISGTNTGSVTEDVDPNNNNLLEISGKLNITDPDAGEAAFIATTYNGNYGGLTINAAGSWGYAASNSQSVIQNLITGATLTDSLTISSVDGTTHTITITIIGVNENIATTNITLSWVAPVAREDNSPLSLSAITGYKVYYGTTPGQYSNSATINNSAATGYTINNLPSTTYYLVVTTIDTSGRESQYSTEVVLAI